MSKQTSDDLLHQLREIQATFLGLVAPKDVPVDDLVRLGYMLWDINRTADTILKSVKESLRDVACQRNKGAPGSCHLSPHCTVFVDAAMPRLRPDVSIQALRAALTPEQFDEFFKVKLALRSGFKDKLSAAKEDTADVVLKTVDFPDSTPRVCFKDR